MGRTLILYEGKYGHSEKTAAVLREMIPDAECRSAQEAPQSLTDIRTLILVFGFLAYDTAKILKPYLAARQEELAEITVGVVGVGLAKQALPAFLKIIEEPMGRKADASWFVMGGYRVAELDAKDRKLLEEFWSKKGRSLTDMLYYREDAVRLVGREILEIM